MTILLPGFTYYVIEVYLAQPSTSAKARFKGYIHELPSDPPLGASTLEDLARKSRRQTTPFLALAHHFPDEASAEAFMHALPRGEEVTMMVKRAEE